MQPSLPQQYTCAKQRWLCEVSVENDAGVVDEYEIKPDRKLYLEHFLDIVSEEIEKFDDIDGTYWQINIYRVTGGR